MISYKDMTFCLYWSSCTAGEDCNRAFTKEVAQAADEWWNGPGAPISFFSSIPECFIEEEQVNDIKN